jgi:hypothetical protein
VPLSLLSFSPPLPRMPASIPFWFRV